MKDDGDSKLHTDAFLHTKDLATVQAIERIDELRRVANPQILTRNGRNYISIDLVALVEYVQTERVKAVLAAEDKALDYANKLFDLTKQWPDYYQRQLDGDRYRKHHKNVKVVMRDAAALKQGPTNDK